MSLEPGTYQIKSSSTNTTIGRNFIENRSLSPKEVVLQSQPSGYGFHDTLWQIDRSEDETRSYNLKIRGASTGLLDSDASGQIVAILIEGLEGYSRKWILQPAAGIDNPGEGQTFNICKSEEESDLVWTIESDKGTPEGDKQLLALADLDRSNPNQAFTFIKVVNQDQ